MPPSKIRLILNIPTGTKRSRLAQHTVTVKSQSSASNMETERAHNETGNILTGKEGKNMPSLADLLQELRELGGSPGEIDIPYRWYRQILDYAEELTEPEENEDV